MTLKDPADPAVRAALAARNEDRCRAMIAGDLAALEQILAPSLIYVHAAGFVEDRSQHLDVLRSGRVRYLAMWSTIDRCLGGSVWGILHGRLSADVAIEDRPVHVEVIFTSHWVFADDDWRLLAWAAINAQPDSTS